MSSPALFTSFWSNPLIGDLDATMVSISRGQPRYKLPFHYRMAPLLAPSREAFAVQDEDAFYKIYRQQLDEIGVDAILSKLSAISERDGGRSLILLCYERPHEFCHRVGLRDWLRWRDVPIRELQHGDLPRRRDIITPTLFD